jgi:GT2 family glycosyltransferase
MIRIVSATREDAQGFARNALLARVLPGLTFVSRALARIAYLNTRGLPDVYNSELSLADESDIMVFVHDDVLINDWFLAERLHDALSRFDVVGVAGTRRRMPRQPGWGYLDTQWKNEEQEYLSGAVAHIIDQQSRLSVFGETPAEVKLLDGLFLAAKVSVLRRAGVRFDPRFKFHFYDLDFSRTCEQAGLRMGTWPIAVTHGSTGNFGTPAWQSAYEAYLEKWKE